MAENKSPGQVRYRTQYLDPPEKRGCIDRRMLNCFIEKDRRCGVACRRKEQQREMERRMAIRKIHFYPEYHRFV